MKRLLWLLFCAFVWRIPAVAQCTIVAATDKVCLGNTVSFNLSPLSANDSLYSWDFGDGSSSTQSNPTYQYQTSGVFVVKLTIYKKGGTSCVATPVNIRVFPRPIANFTVTGGKTQCFNQNKFVINDLSGPGGSNAPIKRRIFLFGDGDFDQRMQPPFPNPLNHVYQNPLGGTYPVVMEVEDTNGCIQQKVDTFQVFPAVRADFFFAANYQCGSAWVRFVNFSEVNPQNLELKWDMGNGVQIQDDTTHNAFWYQYVGVGDYVPTLYLKDKNGCRDTMVSQDTIRTFSPDSIIIISPLDKSCFRGNKFNFSNNTNVSSPFAFYWQFEKLDIGYQQDSLKKLIQDAVFPTCGLYNVRLNFAHYDCRFETDTQVYVYGPQAYLTSSTQAPVNWIQCGSHDTVKFRLNDINCYYNNARMNFLWDFDDPYAPACTTDTRNNINVNMNCRYSKDSADVWHKYSQPNQNCYTARMYVSDPDLGCRDTAFVFLRLAYPKAGWDSLNTPPSPRSYATSSVCSQRPVVITWGLVEPRCGAEKVRLCVDTTCKPQRWIDIDSINLNQKYEVLSGDICSKDSIIHYALAVRNGVDALGNPCWDTGYYVFKWIIPPVQVVLSAKLDDEDNCTPYRYRIYTNDSIRKDIRILKYTFDDGSLPIIINMGINDTIIRSIYHSYSKPGEYKIGLTVFSNEECSAHSDIFIKFGKQASLRIETPRVCNNAPAQFKARIRYDNDTNLYYWSDTSRANLGKEMLYWNFGDNGTWYPGTEQITHRYAQPGYYRVKLAYKDSISSNCFDTLDNFSYLVQVLGAKAIATSSADTFYCAPAIVTFTDNSFGIDPTNQPDPGLISSRLWTFDAGKGTSSLVEPGVFYTENGVYTAKLWIETAYGCNDTTSKSIVVLGPTSRFVITNDTFGCVPYTVKLKNTTGQAIRNWIWYFNDPANTILSTDKDTDITFTYNVPGTYRINLLGEDRIYNPTTGSFKTCSQLFPLLDNPQAFHPRQVLVKAYDTIRIQTPDTVCTNVPFNATSFGSTAINSVRWQWGDTSQLQLALVKETVTHQYDSAGVYSIELTPVNIPGACVLPAEKPIVVQSPKAGFEVELTRYPLLRFPNTSSQAVRYWWDFGEPTSPQNNSTEFTGEHMYQLNDSIFVVCLSAFDANDCMDSVCKEINVKARVKIPNVFTPDNEDKLNDAFDIEIEGYLKYDLVIYNRWGTKVYESQTDGLYNDGINWNGKVNNTGAECPDGVYYLIFKYRLITEAEDQVYHGTVTLIRNK